MYGEFFRFLWTGGLAAGVNLTSRYVLNKAMSFEIAVALAYLLGMLTAYVLARQLVFAPSGRAVISELKRFTIVNVFSAVLVWSISRRTGAARFRPTAARPSKISRTSSAS